MSTEYKNYKNISYFKIKQNPNKMYILATQMFNDISTSNIFH